MTTNILVFVAAAFLEIAGCFAFWAWLRRGASPLVAIFLSPLLLFTGWAETRETGGVSAAFILVNSAAGLAGNLASVQALPAALPVWAAAAVVGGIVGSELGSRRIAVPTFRQLLAVVLVVASGKLMLT